MNRTNAIDTILNKSVIKTVNGYLPLYNRIDLIKKSNDDLLLLLLDISNRDVTNDFDTETMIKYNL